MNHGGCDNACDEQASRAYLAAALTDENLANGLFIHKTRDDFSSADEVSPSLMYEQPIRKVCVSQCCRSCSGGQWRPHDLIAQHIDELGHARPEMVQWLCWTCVYVISTAKWFYFVQNRSKPQLKVAMTEQKFAACMLHASAT